ncbi:putative uncharacterized protein [Firmicutes bacterium CAG:646]|nr:putative uncharacterized protein [Firmicutes bacterium CAG:646]
MNCKKLTNYELLLQNAHDENVSVYENFDLNGDETCSSRLCGLYLNGNVALDKDLDTAVEKSCILAEELGHHYTTYGNILSQDSVSNQKQELRARMWAYNKLIGLMGIIKSYEHGCQTYHEMAEYLDVTEEFLRDALEKYRQKYGVCTTVDNYIIYFEPGLGVVKMN